MMMPLRWDRHQWSNSSMTNMTCQRENQKQKSQNPNQTFANAGKVPPNHFKPSKRSSQGGKTQQQKQHQHGSPVGTSKADEPHSTDEQMEAVPKKRPKPSAADSKPSDRTVSISQNDKPRNMRRTRSQSKTGAQTPQQQSPQHEHGSPEADDPRSALVLQEVVPRNCFKRSAADSKSGDSIASISQNVNQKPGSRRTSRTHSKYLAQRGQIPQQQQQQQLRQRQQQQFLQHQHDSLVGTSKVDEPHSTDEELEAVPKKCPKPSAADSKSSDRAVSTSQNVNGKPGSRRRVKSQGKRLVQGCKIQQQQWYNQQQQQQQQQSQQHTHDLSQGASTPHGPHPPVAQMEQRPKWSALDRKPSDRSVSISQNVKQEEPRNMRRTRSRSKKLARGDQTLQQPQQRQQQQQRQKQSQQQHHLSKGTSVQPNLGVKEMVAPLDSMPQPQASERPEDSSKVRVTGVGLKEDDLPLLVPYFESKRSGGGPIASTDVNEEHGTAVITFKSPEDARSVAEKGLHCLGDWELRVYMAHSTHSVPTVSHTKPDQTGTNETLIQTQDSRFGETTDSSQKIQVDEGAQKHVTGRTSDVKRDIDPSKMNILNMMTPDHKKRIQNSFDHLVENITPDEVVNKLVASGCLSLSESEDIGNQSVSNKSVEKLLRAIIRKSNQCFYNLVNALLETEQFHCAALLIEGETLLKIKISGSAIFLPEFADKVKGSVLYVPEEDAPIFAKRLKKDAEIINIGRGCIALTVKCRSSEALRNLLEAVRDKTMQTLFYESFLKDNELVPKDVGPDDIKMRIEPLQFYSDVSERSIVVEGFHPYVIRNSLKQLFENSDKTGGGPIEQIKMDGEGVAMIAFKEREVAERVLQRQQAVCPIDVVMKRPPAPQPQVLDQPELSCTVKVSGLDKWIRNYPESLMEFFTNKDESYGGPVANLDVDETEGTVFVTFDSAEDAKRVANKGQHSLRGCKFTTAIVPARPSDTGLQGTDKAGRAEKEETTQEIGVPDSKVVSSTKVSGIPSTSQQEFIVEEPEDQGSWLDEGDRLTEPTSSEGKETEEEPGESGLFPYQALSLLHNQAQSLAVLLSESRSMFGSQLMKTSGRKAGQEPGGSGVDQPLVKPWISDNDILSDPGSVSTSKSGSVSGSQLMKTSVMTGEKTEEEPGESDATQSKTGQ